MKRLAIILATICSISFVSAQSYKIENGHAEVHGKAPTASYTGVSDDLQGTFNSTSGAVDFKIRLESLDTHNSKRNKHMYETLDVSSHPYATFAGRVISGFHTNKQGVQNVVVKGNFEIHGVSKEIEVKGTLEKTSKGLNFTASIPIKITEYGMERPKVLAYKVDDDHLIEVNGTLKPEESTAGSKE